MEARFRNYIAPPNENGCWLWTGSVNRITPNYSRPQFSVATSKPDAAYRVAYRLWKGEIPAGQCVRHTCDNPLCVNPDHLLLGTHADNMRDMKERGRGHVAKPAIQGEKHGLAKLTDEQVRAIRASTKTKPFVDAFGVSRSTIKAIRSGRIWKHVSAENK